MATIPEAARIQQQAVEMMRQALDDTHLDRERVSRAFNAQLAALKFPPRPMIFYPNLIAALKRMRELTKVSYAVAWDDAWAHASVAAATAPAWDAASDMARDAAREAETIAARVTASGAAQTAVMRHARNIVRDGDWFDAKDVVRDAAFNWYCNRVEIDSNIRALAWMKAWPAVLSGALPPDHPLMIWARGFLEIPRGGAVFFWIAPHAAHVVLAQIYTQKTDRVFETREIRETFVRVHREDGPAVQYEDGSGLYFWKGTQVPEQAILRLHEMCVKDILAERNAEVRRALMDRYGQDRFVLDAGAKTLDEWKGNELLAIDLPVDPDQRLVALKLRCPSTAAVYIIRVPPDQETVQGALAWSFGLDGPEQYVLQQES